MMCAGQIRALRRQKRESGESDVNADAEARRIAAELVKLHKAGAIKSGRDAPFYANLAYLFGASFVGREGIHLLGSPNDAP